MRFRAVLSHSKSTQERHFSDSFKLLEFSHKTLFLSHSDFKNITYITYKYIAHTLSRTCSPIKITKGTSKFPLWNHQLRSQQDG